MTGSRAKPITGCSSPATRPTIPTSVSPKTSIASLDTSLSLTLGLLNSVVTLFSFVGILWELSGPITIPLWQHVDHHSGLYGLVRHSLCDRRHYGTIKIGRPLVALNFAQQRYEADFRFSLVRLRENAESVALYGGEPREHTIFTAASLTWSIISGRSCAVSRCSAGGPISTASSRSSSLISSRRRVSSRARSSSAGLMQIADAFGQVQSSLSFVINSYTSGTGANDTGIAAWRAVVQRLVGFDDRVRAIAAEARASSRSMSSAKARALPSPASISRCRMVRSCYIRSTSRPSRARRC